ncbi:ABC transporter ATP-binding protein [Corynebacterium sp.]|uniref:ABC transporter ATP-binding protein n=1 Tax=Corynebacterium sp. TaxID=1720 RepID=UPI0026DAE8EF|nr:ABC transporter ATP-binding protein [Corynebacterium sp.]MDO5077099.1 ABC transporter ATP-binding protein [Corynebacterium sp.]
MSIELRDASVAYGPKTVVSNVSFTCAPGTVTALVGPNGCGKSTLLRAIAGVHQYGGDITINGASLASYPRRERVHQLAFVAQYTESETDLTVRHIVSLGRVAGKGPWASMTQHDRDVVARSLADVDIEHLADRPWSRLSGGEKQRSHVARALAQDAQTLVLDEPTNHLDIHHQYELMDLCANLAHERDVCVLAAIHDLGLAARFCDHIVVLHQGGVLDQGPPREVLNAENLRRVFRIDAQLRVSEAGIVGLECAGTIAHTA